MAQIPEENPKQRSLYAKTFSLAVELGFIIALPLLGFVFLGKFLDSHYHTGNKIFQYGGIILALATTVALFLRRIKDIMKDMPK